MPLLASKLGCVIHESEDDNSYVAENDGRLAGPQTHRNASQVHPLHNFRSAALTLSEDHVVRIIEQSASSTHPSAKGSQGTTSAALQKKMLEVDEDPLKPYRFHKTFPRTAALSRGLIAAVAPHHVVADLEAGGTIAAVFLRTRGFLEPTSVIRSKSSKYTH